MHFFLLTKLTMFKIDQALLVEGRCGKLGYKAFIVNAVSMHLSEA